MTFTLAVLLLAAPAAAGEATPGTAPEAPATPPPVRVSVAAACKDVWPKVYTDLDPSWTVDVLRVRPEDERLPAAEALAAFFARLPELDRALAGLDAADRDVFYVRVKTRGLTELRQRYPRVPAELLEAAKVDLCREAAGE